MNRDINTLSPQKGTPVELPWIGWFRWQNHLPGHLDEIPEGCRRRGSVDGDPGQSRDRERFSCPRHQRTALKNQDRMLRFLPTGQVPFGMSDDPRGLNDLADDADQFRFVRRRIGDIVRRPAVPSPVMPGSHQAEPADHQEQVRRPSPTSHKCHNPADRRTDANQQPGIQRDREPAICKNPQRCDPHDDDRRTTVATIRHRSPRSQFNGMRHRGPWSKSSK